MIGDDKKENKWAKALDDAGLLDEVEDAWELPDGDTLTSGATIKVRSTDTSGRPSVPIIESGTPVKVSRDDETQKVITVISADSGKADGEDTVRVAYTDKTAQEDHWSTDKSASRSSSKPFKPVRPSVDSLRGSEQEFVPRTETDPGHLAQHTRISLIDDPQPQYAATSDDGLGWDTLLDDDRPTVEVPRYSQQQHRSDMRSQTAQDEDELEFDLTDDDTPSDGVARNAIDDSYSAERPYTGKRETYDRGKGARITVQGLHDNLYEQESSGMIMDVPMASIVPEPIELSPPSLQIQMTEKYDMNDFSGALDIAEQILEKSPNDIDAFQYRKSCRERLLQIYEARIGDMDRVPALQVNNHELMWRNLDASAGFILSRIDGVSTFADILDISGMPRFETCRILFKLIDDGLIG
ncbi:MAG: hypothetical protein JXX14_23050 [Deltaproteobacteria bacterium]|nr:hypothetical protein [Deltaproteobacteria bacterium]